MRRDGTDQELGTAKQRSLLVALLLDVGRVVPVDRLVELLWGAEPPRSAVANIRTYASRLRAVLNGETEHLLSRPPGYLLTAHADEVDFLRYERFARRAQQELADGRTAAAEALFRQALSLWRGAAAEDIRRSGPLGARLDALDEQRVTLLEDWMESRLRLGDHRAAIPELRELTKTHPLRERLWSQLMLAQYRAGNPGAGLAVFNEVRRTLVDQLGVEPGPALTRLQAAMLAHDPGLRAEHTGADPGTTTVRVCPRELPPDVSALLGRSAELDRIDDAARNSAPVVALHGPAGVGKSALAVHAAHRLAERYPDGQLYVDLGANEPRSAPVTPICVLRRLLRTLSGGGPVDLDDPLEAAARLRTLTAGRRLILVLDNALDEGQVRGLLPGRTGSLVIITSRRMLAALDPVAHVDVGPLPPAVCAGLFARLTGPEPACRPELDQLVELCDGLPLAVRIVAARAAGRPGRSIRSLVEQLADERTRLDALCHDSLSIRASLAASCQQLTHGSRLLRLLGALALRTVHPAIAVAALGGSRFEGDRALDQLLELRLIEQRGPARYRVPDLVRLHAAELDPGEDVQAPLYRVLSWYVRRLAGSARCQTGERGGGDAAPLIGAREERRRADGGAAAPWWRSEQANLQALLHQAYRSGRPLTQRVERLVAVLQPFAGPPATRGPGAGHPAFPRTADLPLPTGRFNLPGHTDERMPR
ncbi:BTAD domain-containing putative transcriptional regulator [Plantactinospora siamensis]|uniref:BTAD domain-containing putative transcriptional regulator n=1 Tax=Plantactinospora siamensis TaxID=555372 RepID=A0ABV6P4F2_9ACTN